MALKVKMNSTDLDELETEIPLKVKIFKLMNK